MGKDETCPVSTGGRGGRKRCAAADLGLHIVLERVGAEALEDEDRRHKVARLHRAHRQNLLAVGRGVSD